MKILWITAKKISVQLDENTKKLSNSGGWLGSMLAVFDSLDEIEKVDIVCLGSSFSDNAQTNGKFTCHYLRGNVLALKPEMNVVHKIQSIIDEDQPDIIDIQGIEFSTGLDLLACKRDCPVVATLQGLPDDIAKVYNLGIPAKTLIFGRTFYDWTHFKGLLEYKKSMEIRGKNSIRILKNVHYVLGRTFWDKANSLKHNSKLQYFHCDRIMRSEFYEQKWCADRMIPHRIFAMQSRQPLKGLHITIEALAILKEKYPDVKLVIPGENSLSDSALKLGGYGKYIHKLIRKYHVEDHIEFTGPLVPAQMIEELLKANVFLQTSLIENSPNSLGEAQMLGVPCVATVAGGTLDYIDNNVSGLLYDRLESGTCAYQVGRVFDEPQLAGRLSENGREKALVRNNPERNMNDLLNAYRAIIADYAR